MQQGGGGGSLEKALDIATHIRSYGESRSDPTALLVGHRSQGFCYLWMGRLHEAEAALETALTQARHVPEGLAHQFGHDPEATALVLLG